MSKAAFAACSAFAGGMLSALVFGGRVVDVIGATVTAGVIAIIVGLFVAGVTHRRESALARRIREGR